MLFNNTPGSAHSAATITATIIDFCEQARIKLERYNRLYYLHTSGVLPLSPQELETLERKAGHLVAIQVLDELIKRLDEVA